MADPVAVAIRHEATMRELTETLKLMEGRLAAIEETLKVTAAAAAPVKKGA